MSLIATSGKASGILRWTRQEKIFPSLPVPTMILKGYCARSGQWPVVASRMAGVTGKFFLQQIT
ncbi:MAG: hypothetical protein KDJ48_16120 [Nitratireductor sp.]|nr:hypothetical protein [Nitratireductor sp.]MCB1456436.1 hypothetical protein [Nitratireductor sp.]MCB1460757.1 hypothetical protein [Nitratireductor sp.]